MQHSHTSTPFSQKKNPIVVLSDGIKSPANIGALFRICDAFGVSELIFTQDIDLKSARLKRTARNTQHNVPFRVVNDSLADVQRLQQEEYHILALEITDLSISLRHFTKPKGQKMVLIIGNERTGISEELLANTDAVLHIDMFGQNSSMNVIQATSIALYALTSD